MDKKQANIEWMIAAEKANTLGLEKFVRDLAPYFDTSVRSVVLRTRRLELLIDVADTAINHKCAK